MNKIYLALCFSFFTIQLNAQQYGLFNTKTLFDGFENPAQKSFTLDYSREVASNFFFPTLTVSAANKGSDDFIRLLTSEGKYTAREVPLGVKQLNTINQNSNTYIATLKVFKSWKHHQEFGFSWQIRSDGRIDYTNETLALLDSYRRFEESGLRDFDEAFNNKGLVQSYHQFSFSYRENYNKQLAFGIKLSLLSGISYNRLNITESNFDRQSNIDPAASEDINIRLKGYYKASFLKWDELENKTFFPTFKNPGASLTFGTTYTAKNGIFIMANIKDLGLIRWRKGAVEADFNRNIQISNPDTLSSKQVENKITDVILESAKTKGFFAPTNARVDFLISKTYERYKPSLLFSKNVFYKGGDAAFINQYQFNDFSLSAIPAYNFDGFFLFGAQAMYQTPNFEVFLGSDNLFKTISQTKASINRDATIGSGYNGLSFYMGLGIKFGRPVEHPQNSSVMPGPRDNEPGFFRRLFGGRSGK